MKENLKLIYYVFLENWRECNFLGRAFHIILIPLWILFALIVTPLEYFANFIANLVDCIQKECTKKKYR